MKQDVSGEMLEEITVRAAEESIPRLVEFVSEYALAMMFTDERIGRIGLALKEALGEYRPVRLRFRHGGDHDNVPGTRDGLDRAQHNRHVRAFQYAAFEHVPGSARIGRRGAFDEGDEEVYQGRRVQAGRGQKEEHPRLGRPEIRRLQGVRKTFFHATRVRRIRYKSQGHIFPP